MYPRFFNAQELGKSLKEVATDYVATDGHQVVSRWFHSSQDADLYIWQDTKRNVIKQQLSFYGQVVEWNVLEGVKTGVVVEFEDEGRASSSEIVRFDREAQGRPVSQAVELLRHVPALSDSDREALTANFVSPITASSLPAGEFVERFGSFLKNAPRPQAKSRSFWARVKGLLGF